MMRAAWSSAIAASTAAVALAIAFGSARAASAAGTPRVALDSRTTATDAPASGSSGGAILLPQVEVRALRSRGTSAPDHVTFRVGPATATLYEPVEGGWSGDEIIVATSGPEASPETNVVDGAGLEVAARIPERLFLEGGRVGLREPLDVAGLRVDPAAYWTSTAGLRVRF